MLIFLNGKPYDLWLSTEEQLIFSAAYILKAMEGKFIVYLKAKIASLKYDYEIEEDICDVCVEIAGEIINLTVLLAVEPEPSIKARLLFPLSALPNEIFFRLMRWSEPAAIRTLRQTNHQNKQWVDSINLLDEVLAENFQCHEAHWQDFQKVPHKEKFMNWFKHKEQLPAFLKIMEQGIQTPEGGAFFARWVIAFSNLVVDAFDAIKVDEQSAEQLLLYQLTVSRSWAKESFQATLDKPEFGDAGRINTTYLHLLKSIQYSNKVQMLQTADASVKVALRASLRMRLEDKIYYFNCAGIDFSGRNLSDIPFQNANLRGANLHLARLRRANLRDADLCAADLRGANLCGSELRGTDLRGAILRFGEFVFSRDVVKLRRANLRATDLSKANFRYISLRGADLRGSNLRYINLSGADLREADLSDAYLFYANLSNADLRGADLSNTTLNSANLTGANLSGTKLTNVNMANIDVLAGSPSLFESIEDQYLVSIMDKTFTYLKIEIQLAQTIEELDKILKTNQLGILYAHRNPQAVEKGMEEIFPISKNAEAFEAAIARAKNRIGNKASSSSPEESLLPTSDTPAAMSMVELLDSSSPVFHSPQRKKRALPDDFSQPGDQPVPEENPPELKKAKR